MKTVIKKLFAYMLALNLVFAGNSAVSLSAFAAGISPPRATVVACEALPVGKSVYCTCGFYSANGFYNNINLSENHFDISGTGKVVLSDFQTFYSDGLTVTVRFKLTATYPGQVKLAFKEHAIHDKAGLGCIGSVPRFIDVKIFNVEGENAYVKMTGIEFYLTILAAPLWYLLHLCGLV